MGTVQQALIAAEHAATSGSSDERKALAVLRERARLIGRQLNDLDEERQMIYASPQAIAAIEAHWRVEMETARCEQLMAALRMPPEEAEFQLARQQRALELDVAALEFDDASFAARQQAAAELETDGWIDARRQVEALMTAAEEMRIELTKLERRAEEQDAARKAVRKAAVSATQARLAQIRQEIAQLNREAEGKRLIAINSSASGEQAAERQRLEQQQRVLATDTAALNAEIAKLEAKEAALRKASEAELLKAKEPAAVALAPQSSQASQPPKQPPKAVIKTPIKGGKLPPLKGKMDTEQRARLAALQGKYGTGVAQKMGALGAASRAGAPAAAPP